NKLIDVDSNLENASILRIDQEAEIENVGILRIDQEFLDVIPNFPDELLLNGYFDKNLRPTFFIPDPLKPNSLNKSNSLKEHDPLEEPNPLEEPDPLEEPNSLENSDFLQNYTIESQNKKFLTSKRNLFKLLFLG
ncbi:6796_t:CDS:2, partial [Funneliformis geosporum]